MRSTLLWLAAAATVPNVASLRLPSEVVTRRHALANIGAVALAIPVQAAVAETCWGKCEDEARKAERLAIQTGTNAATAVTTNLSGVEGLIDMTIKREEKERGEPLSDVRKDQIRAKITAMAPKEETLSKKKVKARFRTD
jgi:hypothetical protein